MALLLALLAAQAFGILLADRFAIAPIAAGVVGACSLALGVVFPRPRVAIACALVATCAAGAASLAVEIAAAARDRPLAPIESSFDGTVVSVSRAFGEVEAELARVAPAPGEAQRLPSRVRVRSSAEGAPNPLSDALPGDRVRVRARLRPPDGRANPGVPDRARALARRGVGAIGSLVHPSLCVRLVETESWRPLEPVHRFRASAARKLSAKGEGGALIAALALGERAGLDLERRAELRQLGLSHLLSVSGLHLALAAVGVYRLLLPIARRLALARDARRVALAGAVLAATGYALLAGFGVPVQRSLAMLLALALGVAARRPARRIAPLALAALVILAADPAALFDAGAQMSFLASGALLLGVMIASEDRPLRRRIADLLHTSALATAATAPVAATFGSVSPWGLVANLVAVPWTGLVLLPVSFAATAAAALGASAEPLLRVAAAIADGSLAALSAAAARMPGAFDASPAPHFVWLAVGASLALLAIRRLSLRVAGAGALTLALAAAPPAAIDPAPPRVVALDVGQGDATLVQGRRGALLVDAGTALPGRWDAGASTVVPALRALGVSRLDLVAASHGDLDHRGGLVAVMQAVATERLWLPYGALDDPAFAALVAVARERGVAIEERGAGGATLLAGDLRVATLWPPHDAAVRRSRNDGSLVLRVEVEGGGSILLTGDIERDAEHALVASGAALGADVLKLAHHGSRTSSSRALLDATGGAVAIASAPRFGRFAMPHPEVVQRARDAGYAVWWTGRDGAVLVSLGDRLWVRGWR